MGFLVVMVVNQVVNLWFCAMHFFAGDTVAMRTVLQAVTLCLKQTASVGAPQPHEHPTKPNKHGC